MLIPRDYRKPVIEAVRGDGIYLIGADGRRYIDGCSGALISSIGHCVPEVIDEIAAQMRTLDFAHPSRWRNAASQRAAEAIAELTPADLTNIWFVAGGSEAVESALKLTRQYYVERDGADSPKHLVVGRWNSYHGATFGAMGVGGNVGRKKVFGPMFKEHPKIETHYCYRCPFMLEYPGCGLRCAHALEDAVREHGANTIAAFIAEPIVGSSVGALVPPPEYWPIVRDICSKNDIVLIADEIMTGIGRTGKPFCVDHWNVVPDIIVSAKSMAAGYVPTGGVFASERIAGQIRNGSGHFQHGFTYNANPISCAAVTAVLGYIKRNRLIDNCRIRGEELGSLLSGMTDIPIVGEVRGKGLMQGVEIVMDRKTREPFPKSAAAADVVAAECVKRGLIVYPGTGMVGGTAGDNFLVAPPLTVSAAQIGEIASILRESLTAAAETLLGKKAG